MRKNTAYFKDIFNVKPFHYDCTLGKLVLPWNNQTIDIFIDYTGPQPVYRPVVDGLYPDENCGIHLKGESFNEKDFDEYVTLIKEWDAHLNWVQKEIKSHLDAIYEIIKQRLHPSLLPAVKIFEPWLLIHSGNYALHYDPEQELYFIFKYKSDEPISRRYYWWNLDESFEPIKSGNRNEIADDFIKLVKQELQQLCSVLLYQDEKCKCYFSDVLHFDLMVGNCTLPFILTIHPYTPTLYAECKDSRFSYSEEGICPPSQIIENCNEWEAFCKELTSKLMRHFETVKQNL